MSSSTVLNVAGQGVVGDTVSSAWWPQRFVITQGWGATTYEGEPSGHGQAHWHAGVDIGAPCGTEIDLPQGLPDCKVKWINNPGGYGTALVVQLPGKDVWLGHLRTRLVADGATVRQGQPLAISNNTGNSTGCHIHFEVRPSGGSYGSDVNPSDMLQDPATALGNPAGSSNLSGSPQYEATGAQLVLDPFGIGALSKSLSGIGPAITQAEKSAVNAAEAIGMIVLGGGMMAAAGIVAVSVARRGGLPSAPSLPKLKRGTRSPATAETPEPEAADLDAKVNARLDRAITPPAPAATRRAAVSAKDGARAQLVRDLRGMGYRAPQAEELAARVNWSTNPDRGQALAAALRSGGQPGPSAAPVRRPQTELQKRIAARDTRLRVNRRA